MRVILQVVSGPAQGRQIPLQIGEIARFGRSPAADVSFGDDATMSATHFEVECRPDGCFVRDLDSSAGTLLNEKPVRESPVVNGDTIQAGSTLLTATVQGVAAGTNTNQPEAAAQNPPESDSQDEPLSIVELCELLELDEVSTQLATPEHTPATFVDALIEKEQFMDAVRFLAFYLPKREAVWWGYHSLQTIGPESSTAQEEAAMTATLGWLKDPSEKNRRAAMAIAESGEFKNSACWLALAAFWSGDSIAPEDLPNVPPDETLTSQGVSAALLMTATQGDVNQCHEKYQQMLKAGTEVLAGSLPIPS